MLAIRAARLFDGDSADLVHNPTVLLANGRIAAIETGGDPAADAQVLDLGDVTLLPGLVDAHVHLAFDASADPVGRLATASDEEVLAGMRQAARATLAAGITTVRDLGDRGYLALQLREELANDPLAGPHILAAGPPITTTKGHCWYLGGQADGAEGVRAAVRAHAQRGVDVIKVMASGGELTPGTQSHRSQYGLAELRAAVAEAHQHRLPITAHAHATAAVADVLAAGFDSIEHCTFMTEDGIDERPDLIKTIAASGVVVSATVGMRPGSTPPPRIAARLAALLTHLQRLRQAGVAMVASSDAGIGPAKPHGILPHGVLMMVDRLGWSTLDALRAVTSQPARLCRLGDRKGRLAPGFDADILAVAGNPLTNPEALLDVAAVYRQGRRAA